MLLDILLILVVLILAFDLVRLIVSLMSAPASARWSARMESEARAS